MEKIKFVYPTWDYRILFLRFLNKKNLKIIEELLESVYNRNLGNLYAVVSEFISDGLARISNLEESVSVLMTIPQLKEFLKSKNVKCTGKKDELVERAIHLFSDNEKSNIEKAGQLYLITEKGWASIEEDDKRFKQETDDFQKALIEPLAMFDFKTVFKEISAFYSTYQFPVGLFSTGQNCIDNKVKEVAVNIMQSKFLTDTMNLEKELENKVRAIVCLNYLFKSFGIADFDLEGNMITIWPDFSCKQIQDFLKTSPTGIFQSDDAESQSDVINIFYHTLWIEAANSYELKYIQESNLKNRFNGIDVVAGKNGCKICNGLDSFYSWDEIDRLPKLPKYPGCVCWYTFGGRQD